MIPLCDSGLSPCALMQLSIARTSPECLVSIMSDLVWVISIRQFNTPVWHHASLPYVMHVPEHLYYYEQGFLSSYFYALQTPDLSGPSSPYTLPHLRATPITPCYMVFVAWCDVLHCSVTPLWLSPVWLHYGTLLLISCIMGVHYKWLTHFHPWLH